MIEAGVELRNREGAGKTDPKIKKRPATLSSHGTPEQPSPRTAHVQGTVTRPGCKSPVRATEWHEIAILTLPGTVVRAVPPPFLVTPVICLTGITIDDCWRPP